MRVVSVAAGCLALLGLIALVLFVSGVAAAANDPPPSGGTVTGNWTVNDTRAYNGVTITLAGNLVVESGGILVLDGARLVVDAYVQGQFGIEVRAGGRLAMQNGANLTSSSAAYSLAVRQDGALYVNDSEVRRCGYAWGSDGETAGLFLESDSCALTRTLVTGGYYGVVARGASPSFSGCRFTANSYGAAAVNSSSAFANCTFTYNVNGANLENCSGTFTNCTFALNTGFGLLAYLSSASFGRCDLVSNPSGNCVLMGCDATFSNCTFRDGAYGAYVTQGNPAFSSCTLTGNRYGMYFYKSAATVSDSVLDRNSWYAASCYFGEPSLVRCELSYTGYSAVDGLSYGTGLGAFSSNFSVTGGSVHHNYQGVECRYSSPRLSGADFSDNDISVWAYQSAMQLTGCNITRARLYGAQLQFFCSGVFEGCRFTDSRFGAYLEYFSSTLVLNSTFKGCSWALKLDACGEATGVRGCTFDRNSVGGYIVGSSSRLDSNRFVSNSNASIMCFGSSARISNNTFTACGLDALQLNDCGGLVDGNTFDSNNATAIYCLDSRTEISNNTFNSNGGSGVHITGSKASPRVHDNSFTRNALGVAFTKQSKGSVHRNTFTGNGQGGISLAASSGEIYCNTLTGSARGISCDALSAPFIHGNLISGNEGGVVCHSSSNATIQGNDILDNGRFGIEVVDAWPTITGNTVSGSTDGIRVQGAGGGGTVSLVGNLVQNNTDGVWATDSNLELRECNFTGNGDAGVYTMDGKCGASRCTFFMNEDGLYPAGGSATVTECDFVLNNNSGILCEETTLLVSGCFFFRNTDGVLDLGNSTLDVLDGIYEQNVAFAIYFSDTTRGDWWVEKAASSVDDRFRLAGNLTVFGGASLRLTNATVIMVEAGPGEHAIEVRNGGRLEILQGSLLTTASDEMRFSFRVEAGGNLTFHDGGLERGGKYLGGSLERGGLSLMSSQVSLRGVTFRDCDYGVIAIGITATFQYLTFIECRYAIEAVASDLRIDNSTIYNLDGDKTDVELQQASRVMLVNTTVINGLDRPRSSIQGPGCELSVHWYLSANVAWQNKVVASRAQVTLDAERGGHQLAGYTDEKGWLQWALVLQYVQNSTATDDRNPYTLGARLGNVSRTQEHTFARSYTWYCELQDGLPPVIQIDTPLPGARLNYTPVTLRGLAHDFETGLERLEWSYDGRFYEKAEGTELWTVRAGLDDGSHTVSIRATDAVGNQAVANITFTVKTRITVLELSSPADFSITRSPAVLVSGLTESEARVQVNGRDVGLSSGKFSTMVYLSEGDNIILVSATDDAGNTATLTRRVVLDTQAPFIELLSPRNDSYISVPQAVVSGRTEPGVKVSVNGQPVINSEGRFTLSVDLPNETNLIDVTAQDGAGNVNTSVLVVHVDLVPPAISIGFPRQGQHFGRRNVTLNGTTEPFATVTAGDFTGVAGADGTFRMNVTMLYGNNTLIIRSTDRAGNYDTLTWYVVRDRPEGGRGSPWVPALIALGIVLAVENAAIYLYWRRRGGAAPTAASSVRKGTPGEPAAPGAPAKAAGTGPAAGAPVTVAVAEPVPPEALPVEDEGPAEMVEMK